MPPARHQYETYVRATPEQVWQAITDPAFTRQYFHGTAFDHPLVAQEPYTTSRTDGSPALEGTVEVVEPPHRLVLTWHPLYDAALAAEPPGRVEWHVAPAGEGLTRVRVVHADLAQSPLTWASVEHGWVWILDSMKTLLETGSPLPDVESEAPGATDAVGEWHRMQAVEAAWRALTALGRTEDAAAERQRALAVSIADAGDRAALEADLATDLTPA